MIIAIIGATGLVGKEMLNVLEEKNLPISEIIPVASEKSVGKKINDDGTVKLLNKSDDLNAINNIIDEKLSNLLEKKMTQMLEKKIPIILDNYFKNKK